MTAEERLQKTVAETTEQEATQALERTEDAGDDVVLTDIYGTPWGQVLAGVDPEMLVVSGEPTIEIPPGIPHVD